MSGSSGSGMGSRWAWLLVLPVLAIWVWDAGEPEAGASSVLSKRASGWYGVGQVLSAVDRVPEWGELPWDLLWSPEEKPEIRARRIDDPSNTVLVSAFPWQRPASSKELVELDDFLRRGGLLILAFSGDRLGAMEEEVLESLGLNVNEDLRQPPSWSPEDWWRHRRERWTLMSGEHVFELGALDWAPSAPDAAQVLLAWDPLGSSASQASSSSSALPSSSTVPLAFTFRRLGGQVVILPASLWSNAELLKADNLAGLKDWLEITDDRTWWIDEYHHGRSARDLVQAQVSRLPWDAFMLHLLLIYCLGLWALARRFGPVWQPKPDHSGSTAQFLAGVGSLHDRLGHHGEAAVRLRERLLSLHPRWEEEDPDLPTHEEAAAVSDRASWLRFARAMAHATAHKKTKLQSSSRKPSSRSR